MINYTHDLFIYLFLYLLAFSSDVSLSPYQGSLVNTLQEAHPTAILGVPRVWEKMQEKMKAKGARSCTVAKMVVAWAKGVGLRNNIIKMDLCVNLNIVLLFTCSSRLSR